MEDQVVAIQSLDQATAVSSRHNIRRSRHAELIQQSKNIPRTSEERLRQSLLDDIVSPVNVSSDDKTYLYLAYGSNLSAFTFLGWRGIRPLSQINVVVPSLRLTFDLPGIPYNEPCFGNCAHREEKKENTIKSADVGVNDYHKDRWHKGMVGVVYEVTAKDYSRILETEGGGASYNDVLTDCYVLSPDPSQLVPIEPTGTPFKAHTLFSSGARLVRKDSAYAQCSPRYLKLLTDGAAEHNLPTEYRDYLCQIRTYHITTNIQALGRFIFASVWMPVLLFFFRGGGKVFLKPDGTYPKWYAKVVVAVFVGVWQSYDSWFKPMFGDGERTIGDETDHDDGPKNPNDKSDRVNLQETWNEKSPLLGNMRKVSQFSWNEPGTHDGDEMV